MRMSKWLAFPSIMAVLALGACAEEPEVDLNEGLGEPAAIDVGEDLGFTEYDMDRDTRLAQNEFTGWIGQTGLYNRWNPDNDVGITRDEFGEGTLGLWDTDRDNRLTEAEWNEGVNRFYRDGGDYGTFGDWDLNDDNYLEANEIGEGFETTGLFGEWDVNQDTYLDENEFGEGLFGIFDTDRDTYLAENEWNEGYTGWGWDWGI